MRGCLGEIATTAAANEEALECEAFEFHFYF